MRFLTISFIIFLSSTFLLSCGSSKKVVETPPVVIENPKPQWVNERPNSSTYYLGIGIGNKANTNIDYRQQAKKNALSDLASEISITINSNSFLFTMERDEGFSEEFKSSIKTEINENIEGYELVDSWEDEEVYMTYYRLSKAKYLQIKKEKKDKALRLSYDLFQKALAAEKIADIPGAMKLNTKAILALKEYWNDVNEYSLDGTTIFLDNEIFANMTRMLKGIKLTSLPKEIYLKYNNSYVDQMKIKSSYNGMPVTALPLNIEYHRLSKYGSSKKKYKESKLSNEKGLATFTISSPFLFQKKQEVLVNVDVPKMLGLQSSESKLMQSFIKGLPEVKKYVPLNVLLPKIYILSDEKILGKDESSKTLLNTFKEVLVKRNYEVVSKKIRDGLTIYIKSDTKGTATTSKFVAAYLNGQITVKDNANGKVLYSKSLINIKGVQLDEQKASLKAYEKTAELINKKIISDMLKTIQE